MLSSVEQIKFIPSIIIILALVGGGAYLYLRKARYWSVYKKQYGLLSVGIVVVCFVLITLPNNSVLMSVLTGLIASIIYGVVNIESDPKFAEAVSQEVARLLDGTMPCRVYRESKVSERPFKEDLIDSLKQTEKFYYYGIRMTVIVDCLKEVFLKETKNDVKLDALYFYVPKPENELLSVEDLKSMKKSLNELKDLFIDCKEKYKHDHRVELTISLLNFYPPFHIHQTENRAWFAAVKLDKETIPYPPTYLYKEVESSTRNNGSSSMFETIKRMVEVTSNNAIEMFKKTIPQGDNAIARKNALLETKDEDLFSFLESRINQRIQEKEKALQNLV